ncbi:MAG TPA: hypothetical protein VLK84_06260 [Longimicrobium sp.]|nr:hypothetical protein [Longimicrobium sp.]
MRLFPAISLTLIAIAVALFLVANGLLADLSAFDWLLLIGLSAGAALTGVLLYWGGLKAWVRAGAHPFSLRLLSGLAAVVLWWTAFVILFWTAVASRLPVEEVALRTTLVAAFLAVMGLLLWLAYATRRRIWEA